MRLILNIIKATTKDMGHKVIWVTDNDFFSQCPSTCADKTGYFDLFVSSSQ